MDALLASKWTLESDRQLFEVLHDLSRSTLERASTCFTKLKSLTDHLENTERSVRDASNRLAALKNVQFIDCQVVESQPEAVEVTPHRGTNADDLAQPSSTAGRGEELDPFADRPLPCIIGSEAFYNDPHTGLNDPPSAEEPAPEESDDFAENSLTYEREDAAARAIFEAPPGYAAGPDSKPSFILVPESERSFLAPPAAHSSSAPPEVQLPIKPVGSLPSPSVQVREEEADDLFSATPFQAPSTIQPIADAGNAVRRGPPPPPPTRTTRDLLFEDDEGEGLFQAHPVTVPVVAVDRFSVPLAQGGGADSLPLERGVNDRVRTSTVAVTVEVQANPVASKTQVELSKTTEISVKAILDEPKAMAAKLTAEPVKRKGLFDDDDEDEDDGLVY